MWVGLDPNASLANVYSPLHCLANFEQMWSIAELRLPIADINGLCTWLQQQAAGRLSQWVLAPRFESIDGKHATTSQMLGALLLCAGAERCREQSNEDSVWPTIRKLIPQASDLFLYNGQPSALTREAIGDAVRALNLRHAMDIDDTQRWFITIKLQYGFTYKGARNRLAEWLVNLGTPQAVQYLVHGSTGLSCAQFKALWTTLKQFRQGRIDEADTRVALTANPWIKPHWLDELLREATARIETLGRGDGDVDTPTAVIEEEAVCPVAGIWLNWPDRQPPSLSLSLDKDVVSEQVGDSSSLGRIDFVIDGKRKGHWTRTNNQDWNGFSEIRTDSASVTDPPRTFLVQSRAGETLISWDFADSGLADDLVFFDLDHNRIVRGLIERLDPNTHYALLCDTGCDITGCSVMQTFQPANARRKLLRLPVPLDENVMVHYADYVLCQPVCEPSLRLAEDLIALVTPGEKVYDLGDATVLNVEGVPDEADDAQLLIHTKDYALEATPDGWRTTQPVTLTPQFCAGQRRVRMRFQIDDAWRTREPRLRLRVSGIAMEDGNHTLKAIRRGDEINRSSGAVCLRAWVPKPEDSTLWEGNCKLRSLRGCKVRLTDLPGCGGELCAVHGESVHLFDVRCMDRGRLESLRLGLLGQPGALTFSQDTDPQDFGSDGAGGDGFAVWAWTLGNKGRAQLERLPQTALQGKATKRLWPMALPSLPLAVALAWKGRLQGAWWDLQRLSDYLAAHQADSQTFMLLKWLRVPLFHPILETVIAQKIRQSPCEFLRAWRLNEGLHSPLRSSDDRDGAGSIERYFLWASFPKLAHPAALQLISGWQANSAGRANDVAKLAKLVDVSLDLMWAGLEQVLANNLSEIIGLLCAFICARLGLDLRVDALEPWPPRSVAARIGRRLGFREAHVAGAVGMDAESLHDLASRWISARQGNNISAEDTATLKRIAEYSSGRNYFACRLCAHWLNAAGMGIPL